MEKKYTESDFLEMFKRVKTEEKKRKATTRGLVGVSARNFLKLVKAGYTPEEFEQATIAMFRDPEQWAVTTGNDIPEHLLRPDAFARYLNKYKNPTPKIEPEPTIKTNFQPKPEPTIRQRFEVDEVAVNKARELYSLSLKTGEWIGSILDARLIGESFSKVFTTDEKKEMLLCAEIEVEMPIEKPNIESTTQMLERMARSYPRNIMFENAVKEAVKRKIKEPWM